MTWTHCIYVALVLLACAVYVPYLSNPLVFDDVGALSPQVLMEFIYRIDGSNIMRWLPNATLAHTYLLTDGSVVAMRLGNLALHALTAIAVYKLFYELNVIVAPPSAHGGHQDRSGALTIALFAAAIFAVHPLNVYAVGYLTQRTIIMSTLFMLLMLIAFSRWLVSGRRSLCVWAALCYLLSVFSKEHSVMAPAVALLLAITLRQHLRVSQRELWACFMVFAAITALIVMMRNTGGLLGTTYEVSTMEMISGGAEPRLKALMAQGEGYRISMLTQMALFSKYLLRWLIPNPQWMAIDMRVPFAYDFWAWRNWGSAAAFLLYPLLALAMLWRGGRAGIAGWALAIPWVLFATELSTERIQEPFVLYRTYLWFALFGVLPGLLATRLSPKVLAAAAVSVVCVMVPLSWNRLATLSDPVLLWDDAAKLLKHGDEIGAGRIYYNRGLALHGAKRKLEALEDFNRAIAIHPKFAPVRDGRARLLVELKRFDEALQDFNAAIALDSSRTAPYVGRGVTLQQLGRMEEARHDFRKACAMGNVIGCHIAKRMDPVEKSE